MSQRFDLASTNPGPTRLVLGGIHGREWRTTAPILIKFAVEGPPPSGALVIVPRLGATESKHLSTLRRGYYFTVEGRRLLSLIEEIHPRIYVELHCYRNSAYAALTDPDRRGRKGVPPLVDLGHGLLIGSPSHHVLPFLGTTLGILLEVPCGCGERGDILALLRIARDSRSTDEALEGLRAKYPGQVSKALQLYDEWVQGRRSQVGGKAGRGG
jgi:hypothetical protein